MDDVRFILEVEQHYLYDTTKAMSERGPVGDSSGPLFLTIPTPSAHRGFPLYLRWPVRPWDRRSLRTGSRTQPAILAKHVAKCSLFIVTTRSKQAYVKMKSKSFGNSRPVFPNLFSVMAPLEKFQNVVAWPAIERPQVRTSSDVPLPFPCIKSNIDDSSVGVP